MKTIQFENYGDSSVLTIVEAQQPQLTEMNVLIKVMATSVNPLDIKIRNGEMKSFMPVALPHTPGLDVAGIVESVGEKVTRFKVGDKVFATTLGGTYSEIISVEERIVCAMPENLSFAEAAAAAVPLTTAYSVLIEQGNLQPEQTVLILGASGGVGHVMVQMAKYIGANVLATASGKGLEYVQALGADQAINYKSDQELLKIPAVDMIVDLVGGTTLLDIFQKIKPGGLLLSVVMPNIEDIGEKLGARGKFVYGVPAYEKLLYGKTAVEAGAIKIRVFKNYDFSEVAQAQDLLDGGSVHGKIVLTLNGNTPSIS